MSLGGSRRTGAQVEVAENAIGTCVLFRIKLHHKLLRMFSSAIYMGGHVKEFQNQGSGYADFRFDNTKVIVA